MQNMTEEQIQKIRDRQHRNRIRSYQKHLIKQQMKKERFFGVNRMLQLVQPANRVGSLRNCLRWSSRESKEHIMKKLELCMELKFIGHEFLTEAVFLKGGRCDVLDLTDGTVYEVLHSETEKMFEKNKTGCYPPELEIRKIRY